MRNRILGLLPAFSLISVGYAAYQSPDIVVSYTSEELNANYLKVVPVPVITSEMYCIENVEAVATVEVEPVTLFEIASTEESLKKVLFEEERFYAFVEDIPKQVPIYIINNNDAGYTRIITSSYGGPGLSCS